MAFLDGELPAADAQAVSVHLDHCAECARIADQFRGTSHSLSQWKVSAVPAALDKSVIDQLSKITSRVRIGAANIFRLAATAAALLLFLAISIPNLRRSNREPGKSSATTRRLTPVDISDYVGKLSMEDRKIAGGGGGGRAESSAFEKTMIARTIALAIVTKDFLASRASLDAILARHHGYAAQLTVSTTENAARSVQASLRIPAAELSSAVADLKALGRVESESQGGEEVTQEHADLVARLKNSRETEQRLQAILLQRTGKIADVLAVEQEIARVRGEIEEMEAEQKNLEHRVDFAAVKLQLTEEYKAQLNPPAASVSTRIHNAFVAGYRGASETILSFVLFFAESGPTLLIWLLIFFVPGWILWRRYRRSLATS
jgi:hypothetical protein